MTMQETQYLTATDVTRLLRIDKSTVYRMAEDGRLTGVKVGRQWRFPADELERALGIDLSTAPGPSVIDVEQAEGLSALFADLYGVMAVVTDLEGRPLTPVSNASDYFALLSENADVVSTCIAEWRAHAADQDFQPTLQPSRFGFLCARAFVRSGFELVGMVIAGGIGDEDWPPAPARLRELAASARVDATDLAATVESVPKLDELASSSMLTALSILARHLSPDQIPTSQIPTRSTS